MTDFTKNVRPEAREFVRNIALLAASIGGDRVTAQDDLALDACELLLNYIAVELGPNNLNFLAKVWQLPKGEYAEAREAAYRCLAGALQGSGDDPEEYWQGVLDRRKVV